MSMEFDSNFTDRCAMQQRANVSLMYEQIYIQTSGYYGIVPFVKDADPRYDAEAFLAQRVQIELALREREGRTDPVRAIDVGAGLGATMIKLGGYNKEAVENGQLELYATSIGRPPEDYLEDAAYLAQKGTANPRAVAMLTRLYEEHGDKVTYLDIDMSHMEGIPDEMQGTFDIVHELNAVTAWSRIPELHIRRMGELTAPDGIYLVNHEGLLGPTNAQDLQTRMDAVHEAHQALQTDLGMTMTDTVQAGAHAGQQMTYEAFLGPDAFPVATFLPDK